MHHFICPILLQILAFAQRVLIGASIKAFREANTAVAETDAASAARKDDQGNPKPYSADEALAESLRRFYLRFADAANMPDIIVRRLIQAAHLYSRLKTLGA